ncbi:hypothetical protein [Variovorax sp. CY25R-8]|uniref:hypothetical protein n=1 Tax=Variovorax sp. CY25R-8 TaxID=2855501 RepID=UPI0021BB35E2|nr:hypothetical protein [Variovorax sp. CY25R-8]MCT8178149.1 hypothetical protein [Variovorax sp. CY25R-8]
MIKIDIEDCKMNSVSTVVSAPANIGEMAVRAVGTDFGNVGTMFDFRDVTLFFDREGLPLDTPPEVLHEALALLISVKDRPVEERKEVLRGSKLAEILGGAASLATIYSTLAPLLWG